jgi:hypothetical protein
VEVRAPARSANMLGLIISIFALVGTFLPTNVLVVAGIVASMGFFHSLIVAENMFGVYAMTVPFNVYDSISAYYIRRSFMQITMARAWRK